jgi:hypothetical protein
MNGILFAQSTLKDKDFTKIRRFVFLWRIGSYDKYLSGAYSAMVHRPCSEETHILAIIPINILWHAYPEYLCAIVIFCGYKT